jgi:hypothetical protein
VVGVVAPVTPVGPVGPVGPDGLVGLDDVIVVSVAVVELWVDIKIAENNFFCQMEKGQQILLLNRIIARLS